MAFVTKMCNPLGDEIDANSVQIPGSTSLNSALKPVPGDRTFPLFSSLPKELRLQIWEQATPRDRVVHVGIFPFHDENGEIEEAPVRWLEKNHLGNPITGPTYYLLMEDPRLQHPLFTVNREARQVVLKFYRIQIPLSCSRAHYRDQTPAYKAQKTLYFNPEHDVLQVKAEEPVSRTLIDFLWDLKAYDPKGVGLLKLATNLNEFNSNDLQYLKRSDLMLIRQRQVFFDTLSQLQEVWFINEERVKHGYVQNIGNMEGNFPFRLRLMDFENLGPESRHGAETALKRVYLGAIDPRELIWRWQRLLRRWQIRHPPGQVKYRVVMAWRLDPLRTVDTLSRIMDTLTLWHSPEKQFACCACKSGGSSLAEKVAVKGAEAWKATAIGFWSFPIEAMGEIDEGDRLGDMEFTSGRIADLRNYWPELLVANMA